MNATTTEQATALLARVTLTGLRTHKTRNGIAWTATLRMDGKAALRVAQGGNGGCNTYDPALGSDHAASRALVGQLAAAATALGVGSFAALDTLTSTMGAGMTGLDGVWLALEYAKEGAK